MPAPTTVCTLCGKEVSKRSTLSLAVLGGGQGRACRKHDEVAEMATTLAEKANEERVVRAIQRRFSVMSAAAGIRVLCSLHGFTVEFLCAHLRTIYSRDIALIREVEEEVNRLGGPIMSDAEMTEAVMSAIWVSQKHKELGL